MDTGLGREGYSNIGQGRIDEILSLKSGDRREIFEEAAGISKYRHRKEETERKLEHTQDNLLRIGDKVSELELQLEPLKVQSEKAKQYLELKEELKGVEVAVWLDTLEKLSAAAKKAEEDYASASFVLQQAMTTWILFTVRRRNWRRRCAPGMEIWKPSAESEYAQRYPSAAGGADGGSPGKCGEQPVQPFPDRGGTEGPGRSQRGHCSSD